MARGFGEAKNLVSATKVRFAGWNRNLVAFSELG